MQSQIIKKDISNKKKTMAMDPPASGQKEAPRHTSKRRPYSFQWLTTAAFVLLAITANFLLDLDFYSTLPSSTGRNDNYILNATVARRSLLGEGRPKVAWLMSFPNSGTTYTLKFIQNTTQTTTATNYGAHEQSSRNTISVYSDVPEGPFFRHLDQPAPETFILTKTHCGGTCLGCRPQVYVVNETQFEQSCRLGNRKVNGNLSAITYPANVTKAAVHLIRNPFDNIVARLHYEQKKWRKPQGQGQSSKKTQQYAHNLYNFTDDRQGFQRWCKHVDAIDINFRGGEGFSADLLKELAKVPCYAEFGRYIQWHNLATETTKRLKLPTHTLFYENYTENFNDTTDQLLSFLQLNRSDSGTPPVFIEQKHYPGYYTPGQIGRVAIMARTLATPDCWELVRHYFEDDEADDDEDDDTV
jgi:hypothetical protein